jgi:cytochrome c-type biogenesis protein CcmH
VTILFWIIIAVLVLVAIALLALPLLKNTPLERVDAAQRNVAILRQQLAELQQQLDEGVLSAAQYDAQYQELLLDLNDELDADTIASPATGNGRWMIPVVAVFVPLLSLVLYVQLADPQALEKAEAQQQTEKNMADVRGMIPQIIERLKQRPDDVQGWVMLGKSYSFIQDYPQAAQVFAKLDQIAPDQPEILLLYAEALAMSRNGQLAGEPSELAFKAVQLAPDNKDALWMTAIAKLEAEEQPQALAYLQKLKSLLPADAEALPQIQQMIAQISATATAASGQTLPADAVSIKVKVSVDSAVRNKTRPEQILFVYAQAVEGPKMPLVITRKRVAHLPVSVELNDSMAIQPNLHLASYKKLRIVARISKTGDATSQKGDLIGAAVIDLPVNDQPIGILINQEVQ